VPCGSARSNLQGLKASTEDGEREIALSTDETASTVTDSAQAQPGFVAQDFKQDAESESKQEEEEVKEKKTSNTSKLRIRSKKLLSSSKKKLNQHHHHEEMPESEKIQAGTTMTMIVDGDDSQDFNCWSQGNPKIFNVRQVGYKETKKKSPSNDSLFDCVAMDLVRGKSKIEFIHHVAELPGPREGDHPELLRRSGLPRLIVINTQVPMRGPGTFGADTGVSLVWYFAIKPATLAAAAENDCERPEINLLKRFCAQHEENDDIRRRFKAIALAENFSDLGLSHRMEKLNGKPVILFKTAHVERFDNVLEIRVMVHKFSIMARGIFHQFKELATKTEIRNAFLLQGEDDHTELPECVLGCTGIHSLKFDQAVDLHAQHS